MDPGALMNEGSFSNVNVNLSSFNLPEIWQLPMNGGGGGSFEEPAGGLGLRMARFEHNLGLLADLSGPNREAVANDPMSLEQKIGHCRAKRQFDVVDESGNGVSTTCSGNGVNQCDGKRLKTSTCRDENRESKTEAEPSSGKSGEQNAQLPPEPPKQDYIHVRARRGQATDSHSLAERARREKISERMKILQDLVPGCNKVIGKALVLDEIINYIQSLQHQVEFLSMKLEAVNSRMCPTIEAFPSKDFDRQTYETSGMAFGSQGTREYSRGSSPEWLHMQLGGGGLEKTS